jgi:hypothetical protein
MSIALLNCFGVAAPGISGKQIQIQFSKEVGVLNVLATVKLFLI